MEPSSSRKSGWTDEFRWLWVVCWLVATAFLLVWYQPFNWRELGGHLRAASPRWLAAAVVANAVVVALWIAQWRCLLPPTHKIPVRRLGEIVALTGAAVNTVPYLGGHAIGFGLLVTRGSLGVAVASSLLAVDQVSRGLVKVLLVCLTVAIVPVPGPLRLPMVTLAVGVLLLCAALLLLARHAQGRGDGLLKQWARTLEAMRRPGVLGAGVALVVLMKGCEAAAIFCVQRGMGVDLPLSGVLLVLLAVNLAGLLQLTPGNIGLFEAAAVLAYRCLGVEVELSVAMAVLLHACALVPPLASGYSVLAWRALTVPRRVELSCASGSN